MIGFLRIETILFTGLITAVCGRVEATTPAGHVEPTVAEDYATLVKEGEARLASGDLRRAEQAFTAAATKNLLEVPNYEVLIRLAEVKCLQGSTTDGLALVKEFQCMLNVEVGATKCFKDAKPGLLGERNDKLSPSCFERMCGEIYLAYYENPSQATLRKVEDLRRETARVERVCKRAPTDR